MFLCKNRHGLHGFIRFLVYVYIYLIRETGVIRAKKLFINIFLLRQSFPSFV